MKIPYNEYYSAYHNDLPGVLSSGRVRVTFKPTNKQDEVRLLIYMRLMNPEVPGQHVKVYSDETHTFEELESLLWEYNFVSSMFVYAIMTRLRVNEELKEKAEEYGLEDVLDSIELFLDTGYGEAVRSLLTETKNNGTTNV